MKNSGMIPKIIHQCWVGDEIPDQLRAYAGKLQLMHPDWKYMLWDNITAQTLVSPDHMSLPSLSTYCGISSYIRLKAVYILGGIYLDMDCECVRPLDKLIEHEAFVGEYLDIPNRVCPAVFGAVPEHSWIDWQLDHFDFKDGFPGAPVDLMSAAPRDGVTILPEHYFYPYRWDGPIWPPQPDTYVTHHWSKLWDKCK